MSWSKSVQLQPECHWEVCSRDLACLEMNDDRRQYSESVLRGTSCRWRGEAWPGRLQTSDLLSLPPGSDRLLYTPFPQEACQSDTCGGTFNSFFRRSVIIPPLVSPFAQSTWLPSPNPAPQS